MQTIKAYVQLTLIFVAALATLLPGCGNDAGPFPGSNECIFGPDCRAEQVSCSSDADCDGGEVCVSRICRNFQWSYVAVVSTTTDDADLLNTASPGPDIDCVELWHDGISTFATTVLDFQQGEPFDGNANNDVSAVLGPNDVIPSRGSTCDVTADLGLYSMGDASGFFIVSFGDVQLASEQIIRVWDANENCDNLDESATESYAVYIGRATADVSNIRSVRDLVAADWLPISATTFNGTEFPLEIP